LDTVSSISTASSCTYKHVPQVVQPTALCLLKNPPCCQPHPSSPQGPCQHNFCLACFKRWLGQGKKTCPTCRAGFPAKFCENPRINTLLTYAIRCAKQGIRNDAPKAYNRIAGEGVSASVFSTSTARKLQHASCVARTALRTAHVLAGSMCALCALTDPKAADRSTNNP
jgi:hypothetical protein